MARSLLRLDAPSLPSLTRGLRAAFVPALLLLPGGLFAGACAGKTSTGESTLSKLEGSQDPTAEGGDVCAAERWYGDGQCDSFCVNQDNDCTPVAGQSMLCGAFVEPGTGQCERAIDDLCRLQDPDCSAPPTGGASVPVPAATDPTVCALYQEASNGTCSLAATDPCLFQDPDCGSGGGGVACPAIAMMPDGTCSLAITYPCRSIDPDCTSTGTGTVCALYVEPANGVCGRPSTDPCAFQDPDCTSAGSGCPLLGRPQPAPDGVCSQSLTDPCNSDPDCATVAVDGGVAVPVDGGSSQLTDAQLAAAITAELDRLNTCTVVSDCLGISYPYCGQSYINASADRSTLDPLLAEYQSRSPAIACTMACACGLLTCTAGKCTTAAGDCSAPPPDSQMVCL